MAGYGTEAGSISYHAARGNTAWSESTTSVRDQARERASDWIDQNYLLRFPGSKTGGRSQARQWPRTGASDASGIDIPDSEIPVEIENATYEAALRELLSPGSLSPDFDGSAKIKRESKKVGTLEKEVEYFDSASTYDGSVPVFFSIDGILASLLLPEISRKSSVVFLQRA